MTSNPWKNFAQIKKMHRIFDGKRAYLDYPPLWVTVGITGNCTFKCDFCCSHNPESKNNELTSHQYKIPFNMNMDDYKKIVNMCHRGGVPHVHICGTGEPFLHPQILEMIDYLSGLYPGDVSLQTDFGKTLFERKNYIDAILRRKKHINRITTDIFPEGIHDSVKKGSDLQYLLDCMERISKESKICFHTNLILTKKTYSGLSGLIETMHSRGINFALNVVNIYPLGFNRFTSKTNAYVSTDEPIHEELQDALKLASRLKINLKVPVPWDEENNNRTPCKMFWQKVQIMPTKKLPKRLWVGNAIPQQCNAVVCGELHSIGNILDYDNFMDFWNNDHLVGIRKRIIEGELPDKACIDCPTGCHGDFRKMSTVEKFKINSLMLVNRTRELFETGFKG